MHHEFSTPEWLAPSGFYQYDVRATSDRNEAKTWAPLCVWAAPSYASAWMYLTFQASATRPPPTNRRYQIQLIEVPSGVSGTPPVGTIWAIPAVGQITVSLPTYRASNGLTGYRFAFTMTAAQPDPGDLDNDGDIDAADLAIFLRCLEGPAGETTASCRPEDLASSNLAGGDSIDLADYAVFARRYTGLLSSRATYVGVEGCVECHEDQHVTWAVTKHASAFARLIADGEQTNPACIGCHTVGYGASDGFLDEQTTPHLTDIQCENCHGPGSHHCLDAEHIPLKRNLSADMCGTCHRSCHGLCGDYYHPHYEQWSTSKHAAALAEIRWRSDYGASCVECHTTDYRLASEDDRPSAWEVAYGLECVACHDPHGTPNEHHLRMSAEALCVQCHTLDGGVPGMTPDRGQGEFMDGMGGFTIEGAPLDGMYPSVFTFLPGTCVYCHVFREAYGGPDQPANSGHTFESNNRACSACHTESVAAENVARVRQEVEARLAGLAPYFDPLGPLYVDPTSLSPDDLLRYRISRFNYDFIIADRSFGTHNSRFARRLLDEAETFFRGGPWDCDEPDLRRRDRGAGGTTGEVAEGQLILQGQVIPLGDVRSYG
ncbi:MAG: multiheme c-type cytochrome [Planctomycetota bacterium]